MSKRLGTPLLTASASVFTTASSSSLHWCLSPGAEPQGLSQLFLFAMGGLHIGPFLPLGQWAPHGIYALSAILLIMAMAADGILGGRIEERTEHIDL